MLPLFQDNFLLGKVTSSHFFRVTTLTQKFLFRGSFFFKTAAFSSFFRTVTFSQELFLNSFFFGAKLLQSRNLLRIGSSLLFGTAFFLEELLTRYFCTVSTLSEKLHFGKNQVFRRAIFHITYFFWRAAILQRLLIQKTLPFIAATFSEELLFYNIFFQKSYYFTAAVSFHSYTSYLFVSN